MKLHADLHPDIVTTTPVSFPGEGLTLTYFSGSIEYSQIYILPSVFNSISQGLETFVKNLHTGLCHDIIYTTPVYLLTLIYFSHSVKHSHIYVYP